MENNKPKQLSHQDELELIRNLIRIMLVVLYTPTTVLMFFALGSLEENLSEAREFVLTMLVWPLKYHLFFFAPLFVCIMNMQMLMAEKRSGVPMLRVSRHFLYASLVVGAVFYGMFIVSLLF
jgi:hypothetical protein